MSQVRNFTLPLLLVFSTAAPLYAQDAVPTENSAAITPPPLSAYGLLPAIEDADLSPDGSRRAVLQTVNGQREIVALDETETVLVRSPIADQKIDSIQWAGNDFLIISLRRADRFAGMKVDEYPITYIFNLKSRKTYYVFEGRQDLLKVTFGSYGIRQVEGRWVGFFGGYSLGRGQYLYRVDLETGKAKEVERAGTYTADFDWVLDENGGRVVTLITEEDGEWKIENSDGKVIKKGKETDDRGIALSGLNADGSAVIYFQFDPIEDEYVAREIALSDGQAVAVPSTPYEADSLYYNPHSSRLIGWRSDELGALPVMIDPTHNNTVKKLSRAFPGKIMRFTDFSDDFNMLLFRVEGPGDPGTWYQFDVAAKNAWPVGQERPGIAPQQVGEIRLIDYAAQDGTELEMIVTLPPGLEPKNLPVIMLPHGGPHAHDEPVFDYWAQALASRGYVVVQPNFRGSTNKDRAFMEAGYGEWGGKMQTDVSDALAHLAGMGMVDANRACIVGASYGGYAALAGVTLQQGIYKCAVSVAGVSDVALMVRNDLEGTYGSSPTSRYYKRAVGEGRDLKMLSPANFAERADAPILLIHGRDDSVVYINQSERMHSRLKGAKKPVEYVILKGEDHWLSRGETRLAMLEAVVAFVEKHNPPGVQPAASAKAGD